MGGACRGEAGESPLLWKRLALAFQGPAGTEALKLGYLRVEMGTGLRHPHCSLKVRSFEEMPGILSLPSAPGALTVVIQTPSDLGGGAGEGVVSTSYR